MKSHRGNRRQFIKSNLLIASAAVIAPDLIPARVLGRDGAVAPGGKIVVGAIGVGPQGLGVLGNFLAQKEVQVVAVSDTKKSQLAEGKNLVDGQYRNQDCRMIDDFQELLSRKDIDAVLIATPDHWHVPVAIAAAKAGKDMYLEKPMGLSVREDQKLRKVIRKRKGVFQFGTQQRSSGSFRLACELVRNNSIGKLKHIDVWCVGSQPGGSSAPAPVPPGLNYERWLGPAPFTPYTENKADRDNKTWWFNYDYALGFIAGWGVHPLDIAFWGFPQMMAGPFTVEGQGVFPREGACNTSVAWDVRFAFANGVTMRYRAMPNNFKTQLPMNDFTDWRRKYGRIVDHGTAFVGEKGWVLVDRTQIRTSPENLVETKFTSGDQQLMRSSNHVRNFVEAIQTRSATICPIEDAVQADILCHLSDIATRLERQLTWNPRKEIFVSDKEANGRLALRPMRAPWRL